MAEASLVSGVAERYGSALFELARDANSLDGVAADIGRFEALIAESGDLRRLIRSPVFSADSQLAAVTALLDRAGIGGLLGNFVKLAARNRRLFALEGMFRSYRAFTAGHRGEVTAEVVSAEPLRESHVADLKTSLQSLTGKTVAMQTTVDPSLLGGLIVKVGSRMIDSSLRSKLAQLKTALKGVR